MGVNVGAVLFDLGGVILESPFPAIAAVEEELGCRAGTVARAVDYSAGTGAFAELERGEIGMDEFDRRFRAETAALGCEIPGAELLARIRAAIPPRPRMLAAVATIRTAGVRVAAVTNTWRADDGWESLAPCFDVFVDSSVEGMRKPDPEIYLETCRRLDVPPERCVFLDDIGSNLVPAAALGMHTILVRDPEGALADLSEVLGFAV